MSVQIEKLEGNLAKLTITCEASEFEKAVEKAYQKNKGRIQMDGFRKGKAPRAMIEQRYGAEIFYDDACNELLPEAYGQALEDEEVKKLDIVSSPEIDVTKMGKGEEFVFTATVALRPEVTLGQYKDFADLKKEEVTVSEEEIEAELKSVQEKNARTVAVEDRPVASGDIATIDFEGFIDGVPFDGGKGEDYDLTIGSHSFIDTFEDQLIGHNKGDQVDVNVTFPENYQAENLAGKPALFKCTVKNIQAKQLPELNDEFADEISDFSTFDAYKEDLVKKLTEKKQQEANNKFRDEVLKKAIAEAKMDIPDLMVQSQTKQMVREYGSRLQMQGLSMDMFLKYTGQTMEQLEESFKGQALTRIQNSLVLKAIADKENITVTDEDLQNEIANMAKAYRMEVEELTKNISDEEKDSIRDDLRIQKAAELLTK